MGRLNIKVPDDIHKQLKIECIVKEQTVQDYVNSILESNLLNEGVKKQ